MKVSKIVLTGGPCAGKTKILEFLTKELKDLGYYVVVVPETASEFIRNSVVPNDDRDHTLMFQDIMLCTQLVKENSSEKYAEFIKDKNNVVILYDRAVMDNRAYLTQDDYDNLLGKYNINEMELIDKYDLVIDLISTATLKQDSYELNDTRSEDIDKASARDKLTSLSWLLHRNLKVIKPTEQLEDKANIVLNHICDLLNNRQNCDEVRIKIDKDKSCFSGYDDNNSKTINLRKEWLNKQQNCCLDYVLVRRQYGFHSSFTLDKIYDQTIVESLSITPEEYTEMVSLYGVREIENIEKKVFIDKGNYFQIVSADGNMYVQTEYKNIESIPDNIIIQDSDIKRLIKK